MEGNLIVLRETRQATGSRCTLFTRKKTSRHFYYGMAVSEKCQYYAAVISIMDLYITLYKIKMEIEKKSKCVSKVHV